MRLNHLPRTVPLRASQAPRWLGLLLGLMLMSLLALPAWADPPGRVGRLAELDGQVWIYATDSGEWIAASRNRPVTTGDRLSTEDDGRAELRIGSTVLRIDANTELEVLQLDDEHLSLQLHSGSVSARLRTREAADEFELTTEEGRFRAEHSGSFRFDRVDDTSSATAWSGQLLYEGEGSALPVQPGQRVEFWKERGAAQYSTTSPAHDGFANWVAERDQRDQRSVSTRYVSPEMTGVEDLDRYGRWEQNADYGPLWIPREVAPGWAPYRMGHWAWVGPWGWTWVDDAPWGFAPFHYGRWVWFRSSWCWTPGHYVARPVYAPALVAWMGGSNLSVSISAGRAPTVGWFPLGPREVYVPGYRVSPRYVQQVNVSHGVRITNVTTIINSPGQVMAGTRYVNRGLPHAVTVVPSAVVERRQPVAPAIRRVNDRLLRDMAREQPRADAPVAAPPRWGATRRVDDPRVSRPGFAPGRPGAERRRGGNAEERGVPSFGGVAPTAPAPRLVDLPRERRGREAIGITAPTTTPNPAPPGVNAAPPAIPGGQPVAPRGGEWRHRPEPGESRGRVLPAPAQRGFIRDNGPPPPAAVPVPSPSRPVFASPPPPPPPAREERARRPELPSPPPAVVVQPPPAAPVMRAIEAQRARDQLREAEGRRPVPEERQNERGERGRGERGERGDHGARGERRNQN